MLIKFYKKDGHWYADVKGHTEEDNEMVFGADELLNRLTKEDHITLEINDAPIPSWNILANILAHDNDGATYMILESNIDSIHEEDTFWICNVTHDVFGEHPAFLYIRYQYGTN